MTYARSALTVFADLLDVLDRLVSKAQHAGLSDAVLSDRLADDMFPLELQFRVALNQVLLAFNQVGGASLPLEETAYETLADVKTRIAAIRALVEDADGADWADADAVVDLVLPNGVRFVMSAEDDIRDWILPNFYFHVTTAYVLLRHAGLSIGKMDFMPHMSRHRVDAPA